MRTTFSKKLFLQKIKEQLPILANVKIYDCKYKAGRFSEWLEFEYGNYCYVFYHAKRWGDGIITYRKCYYDAFAQCERSPMIIGELYSKKFFAKAL